MRTTPKHIQNAERVVAAFGYWPSFHDARVDGVQVDGSTVMFTVHGFEMTSETDERGYFRLSKHHEVRFRFEDVVDVTMPRHSDLLMELEIDDELDSDGRFRVVLESCVGNESEGYGGAFRARSGSVLDVIPSATS